MTAEKMILESAVEHFRSGKVDDALDAILFCPVSWVSAPPGADLLTAWRAVSSPHRAIQAALNRLKQTLGIPIGQKLGPWLRRASKEEQLQALVRAWKD